MTSLQAGSISLYSDNEGKEWSGLASACSTNTKENHGLSECCSCPLCQKSTVSCLMKHVKIGWIQMENCT